MFFMNLFVGLSQGVQIQDDGGCAFWQANKVKS